MNNSRIISTAQNPDLVTTTILVNGTELSSRYPVKSIVVNNELNRIPYAQLAVLDGDPASQDFELSNTDLLIPGSEIEILTGYHNDEQVIFKGIVIKHSIKIREGFSGLFVECKDVFVKMTVGRKSAYFYESSDAEIMEELVSKYGDLSIDAEATETIHPQMVQFEASDWDFMMLRAQANGKITWVENGSISIKAPGIDQEPLETVAFGANIINFDGEIDARNQLEKISAKSWNATDQELIEVDAADQGVALNGNLTKSQLAEVIDLDDLQLRHGGHMPDVELQSWADSKSLFQELSRIRGRVKVQGTDTIKPDTVLKLEGVGDRFNGNIYVSGVRHEITSGNWTVDAQFGLDPKWFSETFEVNTPPASGILPAISGLQIGMVTQLQDDPEGEDRILVRLPIINQEQEGTWARVALLDAGNNRGSFFRPEIDDEVIVGFINDDPNDAVVLGGLHSSANAAPLETSDDNHEKGFVTRSGITFLFNDEKKSVIITTPDGREFTLNDDAGEILIKDGQHSIKLSDSGIDLESAADINLKATGDINMEGKNINVKANLQLKAEGASGAEFSSSAIAVVKGSLVQIN
ncbi:MAG: type VI secretion system tip protein VgrG [Leeuwenhoekiella sp.]